MEINGTPNQTFLSDVLNLSVCEYVNRTNSPQIVRIDSQKYWFEKLVLPSERVVFKSPKNAYLEIYNTSEMFITALLEAKISCASLLIKSEKSLIQSL